MGINSFSRFSFPFSTNSGFLPRSNAFKWFDFLSGLRKYLQKHSWGEPREKSHCMTRKRGILSGEKLIFRPFSFSPVGFSFGFAASPQDIQMQCRGVDFFAIIVGKSWKLLAAWVKVNCSLKGVAVTFPTGFISSAIIFKASKSTKNLLRPSIAHKNFFVCYSHWNSAPQFANLSFNAT